MKKLSLILLLCITIFALLVSEEITETKITVYNQNFGVVKETREIEFKKGVHQYEITDVPSSIDPTSVTFKPETDGIMLLEQNYQFDLLSKEKLLEKYIDKKITVTTKEGRVFTGLYKSGGSSQTNALMLKTEKQIITVEIDNIANIEYESIPENLRSVPTLLWKVNSDSNENAKTEISYHADNINWHAEYIGILSDDETEMEFSAWVSIENRCGKSFHNTGLRLIAGDVRRAWPRPRIQRKGYDQFVEMQGSSVRFEEQEFFEYHLYTLPRNVNLMNNEIKQIALFETKTVEIEKVLRYNIVAGNNDLQIHVRTDNSEGKGLGIPLPAGIIRMNQRASNGNIEFVGENRIQHIPRDEKIDIMLGNSFDIKGETKLMNRETLGPGSEELTFNVDLKNHKKVPAQIEAYYWSRIFDKIVSSGADYETVDAYTVKFTLALAPGEKKSFGFKVRTYYKQ